MYIIEIVINTPWQNVRQARQIRDSLSISEDKVEHQSLEVNISDLLLELSYLSIDKFWEVFGDEASTKRLNICKNIDKYKNMVRYFHTWLALFI